MKAILVPRRNSMSDLERIDLEYIKAIESIGSTSDKNHRTTQKLILAIYREKPDYDPVGSNLGPEFDYTSGRDKMYGRKKALTSEAKETALKILNNFRG